MDTSVFVISKPLQYFNATNITTKGKRILLVVNGFLNADSFADKIRDESEYWQEVYYFDTTKDAFKWLKINKKRFQNIYLNTDFGFIYYSMILPLRFKSIYVFEEGMSAYVVNLRKDPLLFNLSTKNVFINFKRNAIEYIYKLLDNQNYLGGNRFTDGMYVYDMQKRIQEIPQCNKELKRFDRPFLEHLVTFKERDFISKKDEKLLQIVKDKKVVLYLSSWSIAPNIENILSNYNDYIKLFKPHPHLASSVAQCEKFFDYVINGASMVEFLIADLIINAEHITVLHHGSSAVSYFNSQSKLESVVISD